MNRASPAALLLCLCALSAPAAQVPLNLGTGPNTGDGDGVRTTFIKIQTNLTHLFSGTVIGTNSSNLILRGTTTVPTNNSVVAGDIRLDSKTYGLDWYSYAADEIIARSSNGSFFFLGDVIAGPVRATFTGDGSGLTNLLPGVVVVYPGGLSNAVATCTNGSTLLLVGAGETVRARGSELSTPARVSDFSLTLKTNVTIVGLGNYLLTATNFGNVIHLDACSNVVFRNFSVRYTLGLDYPSPLGSNCAAVFLGTNVGVRIAGMNFYDCPRQAVSSLPYGTTEVIVENCYFENCGTANASGNVDGACISGITSNWLITGNRSKNCIFTVEVEGVGASSQGRMFTNITVTGNNAMDCRKWGYTVETTYSTNCHGLTYTGNSAHMRTNDPAVPSWANTAGFLLSGVERSTFTGNSASGFEQGFLVWTASGRQADCRGLSLVGNSISRCWNGIRIDHGAGETGSKLRAISVVANNISDSRNNDIQVAGDSHVIMGNVISLTATNGKYGASDVYCISVTGSGSSDQVTSNILVLNNVAYQLDDDGSKGLAVAAGCFNVVAENNLFGGLPSGFNVLYNSAGDGLITTYLASTNHDFGSTTAGASGTIAVSCAGSLTNYFATVSAPNQFWSTANSSQVSLFAWPSNDVVYVRLQNNNLASAFDPAAMIYKVTVRNHPR